MGDSIGLPEENKDRSKDGALAKLFKYPNEIDIHVLSKKYGKDHDFDSYIYEIDNKEDVAELVKVYNYLTGTFLPQSDEKVFEILTSLSNKGFAPAQYRLGVCYEMKIGVKEQDLEKAVEWYKLAADQEYTQALNILATYLTNGIYFDKNVELGMQKYKLAADLGDEDAQFNVAIMYLDKEDEESKKLGFKYCKMAAEQGSPQAQYNVGALYIMGTGVKKDEKEAFNWYKKAADNGVVRASFYVGQMLLMGVGVKADEEKGSELIYDAAMKGDEQALEFMIRYGNFN